MDIKSIIKIFFFILIAGLIYYLYVVKIPVLCLTCEEPGTLTRCIAGTGKDTPTCDAFKLQQQIVSEVGYAYGVVSDEFGKVTGVFDDAYTKIVNAKATLVEAFSRIGSLNIPNIPPINIPKIDNLSCPINFDGIPAVDVCKSGITPSVNQGAINPINTSITGLQTSINTVVGQLNNAISPINTSINTLTSSVNTIVDDVNNVVNQINNAIRTNIPNVRRVNIGNISTSIGNVSIPTITPVNLSCDINLPALIKEKMGSNTLDVCGLLIAQINNTLVPQLNNSFKVIGDSINIAIVNINTGIQQAITTIQNGISTAIIMLQNQLDALNIFGQLSEKVVDLLNKMGRLNPMGLIQTYILPYIKSWFPFATLSDTITFLFVMLMVPFIIPLFLILNTLIDLIPDINIGGGGDSS